MPGAGPRLRALRRALPAALLGACLLGGAGCPHPAPPGSTADPTPQLGPPDAFGVRAAPDHVLVPRAALVHADGATFVQVDDALVLRRDKSGLLGAVGLGGGDTLVTCGGAPVPDIQAADACFARFFDAATLEIGAERNGTLRTVRVVFDGPPVPVARGTLASIDAQPPPSIERPPLPRADALAAAYGLVREGAGARMPRGALVRLVPDYVWTRPVREANGIVGYEVESPVLTALGWTGVTARIDEIALTSDEAVAEALRRLFTAEAIVVTPLGGGAPWTLTIAGLPTAPPPYWQPRTRIDAQERRIRAGARVEGEHRYVPREALGSLHAIARADVPRRGHPVEDGTYGPITVLRALGSEVADLLDLRWDAPLERLDGVALYGVTSLTALRRSLLISKEVTLELGGASPGRVVVHVEGEPVPLHDGWPARPRSGPDPALTPLDEPFVRDGDTVRTSRLALRAMFFDPVSGHPIRDGVRLAPNLLWGPLDIPPGTVLLAVDGTPATAPTALDDLGTRLCTGSEVTLTLRNDGETFRRVVQIDGPPVTPP